MIFLFKYFAQKTLKLVDWLYKSVNFLRFFFNKIRNANILFTNLQIFIAIAFFGNNTALANNCNYATNIGTAATTNAAGLIKNICWLDLAGVTKATAGTAAGTALAFNLADGSTLSFTLKATFTDPAFGLAATASPTYSAAALGSSATSLGSYNGIAGSPIITAFTQTGALNIRANNDIILTNIVLKDPSGVTVSNFQLVVADGETTNDGGAPQQPEQLKISTTTTGVTWSIIDQIRPGGFTPVNLTGGGTSAVTITGTSNNWADVFLLASSKGPDNVTVRLSTTSGTQGAAFGLITSSVSLAKAVGATGRAAASDQFTYKIANVLGTVPAGAAQTSTGAGANNTNPTLATMPSIAPGNTLLLYETMATGSTSPLSAYTPSVNCTSPAPTLSAQTTTSTYFSFQINTPVPMLTGGTTSSSIPSLAGANYNCTITNLASFDYGEAPNSVPAGASTNSYKTLLAENGARHAIVPGIYLGSGVNSENDGNPVSFGSLISATDNNGVKFNPLGGVDNLLTMSNTGVTANTIVITASVAGFVNGWIDFDQSGVFDTSERVFADTVVAAGVNTFTISVPSSTIPGLTYARFRFTTQSGMATSPSGIAANGEVEDYSVKVTNPLASSVCSSTNPLSYGLNLRWYNTLTSTATSRLYQRVGALSDGTLVDLLFTSDSNITYTVNQQPLIGNQSVFTPGYQNRSYTLKYFVSGTNTPVAFSIASMLTDIDGASTSAPYGTTVGMPAPLQAVESEYIAWKNAQIAEAQYAANAELYRLDAPFTGVASAAAASAYDKMVVGKYQNILESTYPSATAKAVRLITKSVSVFDLLYYGGQFGGVNIDLTGVSSIIQNCPDLSLSKTGPTMTQPSNTMIYTLTTTNITTFIANNTILTDTLPADVTFVSASDSGTNNAGVVTWNLGTIAANATKTVTVTVTAPNVAAVKTGNKTLVNTATVYSPNDIVPANNTSSATTQVAAAELVKQVRNISTGSSFTSKNSGLPSQILEYCIDFKNIGNLLLVNLVVTDDVPKNLSVLLTGYDADEPSTATGFGVKLIRSGTTYYLTSAADADKSSLTTTGGTFTNGILTTNIGNLVVAEAGQVCFKGTIK